MGAGSHLGGGEGAEPDSGFLVGLAHLADPAVGIAAPDALVDGVPRLAELGSARSALGRGGRDGGIGLLVGGGSISGG